MVLAEQLAADLEGAMMFRDRPGFAGGNDNRREVVPDNNADYDRNQPIVTI